MFKNRVPVSHALNAQDSMQDIVVKGWVRTRRDSKGFSFFEINDGSCLKNLQVVADASLESYPVVQELHTGCSVAVKGNLVPSPGQGQNWEMQATQVKMIGSADPESYPLQKKRHSDEFLRTIAQLRPRTNKYGALNRIRSELSFAIHKYFHDQGFYYIHTPIITSSDCEGAGELFRVTKFDLNELGKKGEAADISEDFFGKNAYLTVSGQLAAEVMACALGNVYTFGPTFRAENSNTPRHAAEFWMVEPEMAFADLEDAIDLAEDFLKSIIAHIRSVCSEDMQLFGRFVDKHLFATLDNIQEHNFVRLPYKEAVEILSSVNKKQKFEYEAYFGADLQTEHERYLAEKHFQKPVVVYDYPKTIKPFYMRKNDDDQTVAALDVLLPGVGEIIGGSQREERLNVLQENIQSLGLDEDS